MAAEVYRMTWLPPVAIDSQYAQLLSASPDRRLRFKSGAVATMSLRWFIISIIMTVQSLSGDLLVTYPIRQFEVLLD